MSMQQQHSGLSVPASEGVLRVLFGLFMAFIALVLAVAPVPELFAAMTVLAMVFGAREWHRLVRSPEQRRIADRKPLHIQTAITGVSIALAVMALMLHQFPVALVLIVGGAVAAFVMARRRDDNPLWHAFGVLYLGLPALALAGLRAFPTAAQGTWTIVALFLIVWSTDTGALVFGKLIGGKKLWPAVSPGKTWAGTIGGTFTALMVFAMFAGLLSLKMLPSLAFAAGLSIIAHLGDLFESWVKRRFNTKDSGGLIPGHGGILDRMDSIFAASVALAIMVFGLGLHPTFGGLS
ncbi:MAG: phosphatidate cytidylyltransferase [Alphaproteobacteria bacterium]|nr:phosphatidate cytidylyltransferase [Alphaproteobacteria bacterium]